MNSVSRHTVTYIFMPLDISDAVCCGYTVHGKYLTGEIFGEPCTLFNEENFGEYATVSAYAIYVFHVSVNIGEENFGEWPIFPLPKISCVRYSLSVSARVHNNGLLVLVYILLGCGHLTL